jgi:tetratricopeptide (TPR) repeat protein
MKKLLFLIAIFRTFELFSQTQQEIILKANEFIEVKKYESAYNILNNFDSSNINPEIVILKTDILLKYYVFSFSHQMFTLKDLEINEDVLDYRGKQGFLGNGISFFADSILTNLIKQHPSNCRLYKSLGDYYFEIIKNYGDNWKISTDEQYNLILSNYNKTIDKGCADYMTFYSLGLFKLLQEEYSECINYFLKSLELKNENAELHYNLAYAYLNIDSSKIALKYYENALNLSNDTLYKSNSAFMMGHIYSEFKNDNKALYYYEIAYQINPASEFIFKPLMEIYLKSNNTKYNILADKYLQNASYNPETYSQINSVFNSNNKEKELLLFYASQLEKYNDDKFVLGYVNYFMAMAVIETDKIKAKEYLLSSKSNFISHFESSKITGIGAQLREENGNIVVTKIVEGSASFHQGDLEVGDIILKIAQGNENPIDILNMNIEDVLPMIRGKKGTEVRLTVKKNNEKIETISIIRDIISNANTTQDDEAENNIIENINEELKKCK